MDLANTGIAGALIAVVVIFIKYLQTRDKSLAEKDDKFAKIIQNHMEHENEAFHEMASSLNEIKRYFVGLNGHMKKSRKKR